MQTVRQALRLMKLHDVSQLPVMDGGDVRRLGERLVAVGEEPREPEGARPDGERRDGRAVPGRGLGARRSTRS